LVNSIIKAHRRTTLKEATVPKKPKFTRIPKVNELVCAGVPTEAIPTYCALSDYANNKSGLAWPKMETLAYTLGRSVRTVQRHLHLLKERGLIEFVERRRHKGRFSSYLYRIVHIVSTSSTSPTTGHGRRAVRRGSIYKGTKPPKNPPHSPTKEGYEWLFKEKEVPKSEAQHKRARQTERTEASKRRKEGYEWLFE
jgi:DNA-binding transcriptional MocR family regulator